MQFQAMDGMTLCTTRRALGFQVSGNRRFTFSMGRSAPHLFAYLTRMYGWFWVGWREILEFGLK